MGNSLNGYGQWSTPVLNHAFGASEAACLNTVVVWAYHYVLTLKPIEDRASVLMQRCQNYYTLAGYSVKTKYGSISVTRYGTGGLTSSQPYLKWEIVSIVKRSMVDTCFEARFRSVRSGVFEYGCSLGLSLRSYTYAHRRPSICFDAALSKLLYTRRI
jgi:hypothetical protein